MYYFLEFDSAIVNKMSSENEIDYVINQLLETKVRSTCTSCTTILNLLLLDKFNGIGPTFYGLPWQLMCV